MSKELSQQLQAFLRNVHSVLTQDTLGDWADSVEELLVQPIKAAAPAGATGRLRQSVRKEQGTLKARNQLDIEVNGGQSEAFLAQRNDVDSGPASTQFVIMVGGSLTTKSYGRGGYEREVTIGQGDNTNIGRGTKGVSYDYALAIEYGTHHARAHPFFWPTIRRQFPLLVKRAEAIVSSSLVRLNG